ncbi:hypothetical protein EJ05DRAFT_198942 [Pseudovirgaria hyperparasitica]|uniref:LYR motif-containing protein Cup1-like N-terminal domain-containing protein n=1 Tax=Pseudovirgaria hyperparasitica TaxID=470096 RepID=A0A6A6WH61_9PEZI|nr:uncharacterized protein EJ05DRAFT_198942 [Pseudovirgaria hyperparasitica]KAF2762143.1 hypothetical protein EJ05DRAFT_198942 [Pseudovirgaria hyperparasitica]
MSANLPPRAKTTLQLYRALLREATYLPDPAARTYVHDQVVKRFRKRQCIEDVEKISHGLQQSRSWLSKLQRANHGDSKALGRVLMDTYGRSGARRRQLMERVINTMKLDATVDGTEECLYSDRKFASRVSIKPSKKGYSFAVSKRFPLLHALMASPMARSDDTKPVLSKARIFRVPANNIWEKPIPRKRLKNLARSWDARVLSAISLPLPAEDYERLRDMASGKVPFEGVRTRRPGIVPIPHDMRQKEFSALLESQVSLLRPSTHDTITHQQDKPFNPSSPSFRFVDLANEDMIRKSLLDDAIGAQRLNKDFNWLRNKRSTTITPRMMRRLWKKVLAVSCAAKWDAVASRWTIEGHYEPKVFTRPAELQLIPSISDDIQENRSPQQNHSS